jgi:alpha-galactosidase
MNIPISPTRLVCVGWAAAHTSLVLASAAATWTLATSDTRIDLTVSNAQPVIRLLQTPHAAHNWLPAGTSIPLPKQVWINERETAPAWNFVRATRNRRAGTWALAFTNTSPALALRSVWRARPGRGPIEHWLEIDNHTGQRIRIGHQDSLALDNIQPGAGAALWWIKRGGSNASTQGGTFTEPLTPTLDLNLLSHCEDGASPVPWLAIQVGTARGLYVGWEFSGLGRIAAHGTGTATHPALALRIGNTPDFKTDVEPGATFLVPPAFIGCYLGDIDDGSYTLHRWVLDHLRPPVPAGIADPTLAYNLYLDAGGANAIEADVLRSAAFCRDLGFETFMPDAMWFPECGDWRWDPRRFPQGIVPIEQFVHNAGMSLALWCAWGNGGIASHPAALSVRGPNGHPEWFNADFESDWKPGPFYGAQICLGCDQAKAWALGRTRWLVQHHRLDYLKHDINPIATRCNKITHRHHYGVDASYWATLGYYEIQENLRRLFPNLLLENCSGGGHIKDYGAMARTHYVVTTDTLSNLPDRQSLYDSTFAFPPLVLQAYTYEREYKVPGDDPGSFLWRSAMMGAWQIDPTDTRRWTDDERESARRAAATYKDWIRPLLRDTKVHHILPRPDGIHWDGLFYWSDSQHRGLLFIFRPNAPESDRTIRLKGLSPETRYRLWSEDGATDPLTLTGADLMQHGLPLNLPDRYASDLVFVQEATSTAPRQLKPPGPFALNEARTTRGPFATTATLDWSASTQARCYRVAVADSPDFARPIRTATTFGRSLTLPDLPPDRRLFWRVEAVAWGGRHLNEGGPGSFTTPPPADLSGIVFSSDIPWTHATAGADNPVRRNVNLNNQPIRIAGILCPKGVWTHAFNDATPADCAFDISSLGVASFAALAGLEDSAGGGSVQFQVLVDGAVRAESPILKPGQIHNFLVDVRDAREVRLRVRNGGDGFTCDHAAWGLARFVKTGITDPLESPPHPTTTPR